MALSLFGFTISKSQKEQEQDEQVKSFAPPAPEDGAVTIQSGAYYGTYVDLDGVVRNEIELITRYREMSMQPELETAIDEIVNEAIITEDNGKTVELNTDDLKQPEKIKKKIRDEFDNVLRMLNFGQKGHQIFRRWYVDGRLFYHIIIDEARPAEGIQELRYVDPRRIRKIREIQKTKDETGMEIIKQVKEYYLYNDRGVIGVHSNLGVKIAPDSIVNVNSGLMNPNRTMVISYLNKAIKPLNQLRMVEDATVIYRLSRAPERRVFYVDVGNMSTVKAEQYLKDIMVKYRNKLVYDSATGEIRDDRKHMAMLEDFWLPRREGSKGTEISTLEGGQNLGKMEDVEYFEKKLYKALGVPMSRLDTQSGFSLGRSTEITRDELRFNKFVTHLRSDFTSLFDDILRVQLILKKVCTEEEWEDFREYIWYDFIKDNNFEELKEAELMMNRLSMLGAIDPFVGRYYSQEWVRKNILKQTDDDIAEIDEQMATEAENAVPTDANGNPLPIDPATGQPIDPSMQQPGAPVAPPEPEMPEQGAGLPQHQEAPGFTTPDQDAEQLGPSKFEIQSSEIEFA